MALSLQEQFETAEAITLFGRLFALDQVRTDYLERVEGPIPEEDIDSLAVLTNAMHERLREAEGRAEYLGHIIELHPADLDEGYVRILWTDALSGDQKMRLSFAVERRGNLIESSMMSTAEIQSQALTEREALANEMEAIYSGGSAAGDLSSRFLCNMAIACIAAGLVSLPPMNIVGVTVGLLMMGPVYARGEEC